MADATFYGRRRRPDEEPVGGGTMPQGMPLKAENTGTAVPLQSQPQNTISSQGVVVGGAPVPDRPQQIIGEEEVREAAATLAKYKSGKANLEHRIVEDEQWWKLRHWDVVNKGKEHRENSPEPSSAWLFDTIANKHADAMDNYPEAVVLPREMSDEASAKTLTSILPVVMEYNDFEETYNLNWWEKLKHGTAVYGVFWNNEKENGLGDIDIKDIDLLKIFWEPGIKDIQTSRNLFICDLVDSDLLEEKYPELKGKLRGDIIRVEEYIYDDSVDTSGKSLVIDWYYKRNINGRTILHYCKFVGSNVIYASENDPQYRERGYYDHGKYPVVFDCMFPEKGTPVGFGYVAICKSPQLYIDKLGANILESSLVNTKPRQFVPVNASIDMETYEDWSKSFIPYEGGPNTAAGIIPVQTTPLSGIYTDVYQMKIEEMKDTAANRDVNSGASGSITAASAIAALQEAGNKRSRDYISASYRAHAKISSLCIELMKQFYDETRAFRITADNGQYQFIEMNKQQIGPQVTGVDSMGNMLYRDPIYDLKIKAQKRNPFSKMEENERAKELYSMDFFNPERAQESLMALEMMDFEGIDKVKEQVKQGQTLLNLVQQYSQLIGQLTGVVTNGGMNGGGPAPSAPQPQGGGEGIASNIMQSRSPMTSYGQRLAKRSTPSLDRVNSATNPQ